MSPSMLVHGERHESFRDTDLFALVAVLEYFIEKDKIDVTLREVVSSWKTSCVRSGSGTIIFDFSTIDSDPGLRERLRVALAWLENEMEREWGSEIPMAVINRYDPERVRYSEFSTAEMIDVIRRLRRVIWGCEP